MLDGRMGAQLGDEIVYGQPGDLVFKPRDQWHTFWNAGEESCRILETISAAGFEMFFGELGEQMAAAASGNPAASASPRGCRWPNLSVSPRSFR